MTSKLALEFLCHRSSKCLFFYSHQDNLPIGGKHILASKSHCEKTLPLHSHIICFFFQPQGTHPNPDLLSPPPLCGPPLLNSQPLSFFSFHHVRLVQIDHGRSPIYKSICPPGFSTFHIHCTYTPHLLCVWNLRSSLCLSQTFLRESLSLTPELVLDVENSPL